MVKTEMTFEMKNLPSEIFVESIDKSILRAFFVLTHGDDFPLFPPTVLSNREKGVTNQ